MICHYKHYRLKCWRGDYFKGNVRSITGHEGPEGMQRCNSTLSLTLPRPGRFTSGKESRYPLTRTLGGSQDRSERMQKISPPPGFFCCCFLFELYPYFFFVLIGLAFCLVFLLHNTHNKDIHTPAGFEPATPLSDRSPTLALDRSATGREGYWTQRVSFEVLYNFCLKHFSF